MLKKKQEIQKNEYDETYITMRNQYTERLNSLKGKFRLMQGEYRMGQMMGAEWAALHTEYKKQFQKMYTEMCCLYYDIERYVLANKDKFEYCKDWQALAWDPNRYCIQWAIDI